MKLYTLRTVPLSINRSLFTLHSAKVYVIQVCRELSGRTRMEHHGFSSFLILFQSCLQTCMTYTIAECRVNKLLMMDRGTVRNMYSFTRKWICEISASSWVYYKKICYDAQSHERKIPQGYISCSFQHKRFEAPWSLYLPPAVLHLLTYLPAVYLMVQSPPWENNRFSASQEIPGFYETRSFIAAFTSARHLPLTKARSIHPFPHLTSLSPILVLSSHLRLNVKLPHQNPV